MNVNTDLSFLSVLKGILLYMPYAIVGSLVAFALAWIFSWIFHALPLDALIQVVIIFLFHLLSLGVILVKQKRIKEFFKWPEILFKLVFLFLSITIIGLVLNFLSFQYFGQYLLNVAVSSTGNLAFDGVILLIIYMNILAVSDLLLHLPQILLSLAGKRR